MDFAENYTTGHLEEVQSAYFVKKQITLHPVVVHYKDDNNDDDDDDDTCALKTKSLVVVSDVNLHNSTFVFAVLTKVNKMAKRILPGLQSIHYITDSPTSQYRNSVMLNAVFQHQSAFGIPCTWNYMESGHGKGPCDGIGGCAKRGADLAVKRGTSIQTASDLEKWGNARGKISYEILTQIDYDQATQDVEKMDPVSLVGQGVMKIHAAVANKGHLLVRDTSCYCDCCMKKDFCDGWKTIDLVKLGKKQTERKQKKNENRKGKNPPKTQKKQASTPKNQCKKVKKNTKRTQQAKKNTKRTQQAKDKQINSDAVEGADATLEPRPADGLQDMPPGTTAVTAKVADATSVPGPTDGFQDVALGTTSENHTSNYAVNDFVIANYEGDYFVGKILDHDPVDGDFQISFMSTTLVCKLKWPSRSDIIWVDRGNILRQVKEPIGSRKNKRLFILLDSRG